MYINHSTSKPFELMLDTECLNAVKLPYSPENSEGMPSWSKHTITISLEIYQA
jgi:hypothetical protein